MTYNPNLFCLTHLLQEVYTRLEQSKGLTATGGGTTTVIDTTLSVNYLDNQFVGYTAFVTKDSAGAGAAPEGEFQRVSSYVASTRTITVGTAFSSAIAAGDVVTLTRGSAYPLTDVIRLCNQALQKLGTVRQVDTSLTTGSDQTEFTVPIAIKGKVIDVLIPTNTDTNDNQYRSINFRIIPAASGSTETIVIPQQDSGKTLSLLWEGPHAVLSAFADPISEYIPRDLAVAVCALEVARFKSLINPDLLPKLTQNYNESMARRPVTPMNKKMGGFPHWSC